MERGKEPRGMAAFVIIWGGQVVSLLGTSMTRFALTIWAWQVTGSATALALVGFFSFGPTVMLAPFAGVLVDRWDRKKVMILADLSAGISTLVVLALYSLGSLQVWHLFVTGAFAGAFQAFQWPAFSASITLMVSKKQYGRTSGMISFGESLAGVFAPVFAAALLVIIGLRGVLLVDIITFTVAIGALLMVQVPRPKIIAAGKGWKSVFKDATFGFKYINKRPSLRGLLTIYFILNFFSTLSFILLAPMILSRTGNQTWILAQVLSLGAIGGVIGGLAMSVWGGPKRKINGILGGLVLLGIAGEVLMGLGREVAVWSLAFFMGALLIPIINGSSQAIWQSKVEPGLQGRVFSARMVLAMMASPLAMLLAGPLADKVFEPAMQPGGQLSGTFDVLVGTGPGTGIALIFILFGIVDIAISLLGYASYNIRNIEDILPDHDQSPEDDT